MTSVVKSENRATHFPQTGKVDLQTDHEKHENDAEFGKVHHRFAILTDPTERGRTDDRPDDEVAQNRADAELFAQRRSEGRGDEVDESVEE